MGLLARDMNCGINALEEFAYGRAKLPLETLNAVAKEFFDTNTWLDPHRPLVTEKNRVRSRCPTGTRRRPGGAGGCARQCGVMRGQRGGSRGRAAGLGCRRQNSNRRIGPDRVRSSATFGLQAWLNLFRRNVVAPTLGARRARPATRRTSRAASTAWAASPFLPSITVRSASAMTSLS